MNVSINWVNKYTDLSDVSLDEILRRIGAQLGAVEEVVDVGAKYRGVIITKVISCQKHPDADKLSVCLIDDGGAVTGVERNSEGLVQVVCGAPNVREGLFVAWLPPGSTVPNTVGKDPFVLGARELRGVMSNGMLASSNELAISDDHEGILEITEAVSPGQSFAKHFGLDDVIIDCENKMFTHRPDCFGILGVARELAGICGRSFQSPEWYRETGKRLDLSFPSHNDIPHKVPRFAVQVITDVVVRPSPLYVQSALVRVGSRPINNLVDATNYYMHLTGQPTHAFDYDKVKELCDGEVSIFPRLAVEGEELALLNGKTVKLTAEDIVIATNKQAIALGGVMGGAATEVDENTKNIIVECANFDMYTIRRTSMRHGLFSDAVTRFNKGQSELQNAAVLNKLSQDICEMTGGNLGLAYDSEPENVANHWPALSVGVDFINARLGSALTAEEIMALLTNVEFEVVIDGDNLVVAAPFWRKDIDIPEDIVEEVGRLNGYESLPVGLPSRTTKAAPLNAVLELKHKIRTVLSGAGANEILTYSFVAGKLIEQANQDITQAYKLGNAISPELQYYRLTLTPSVLSKVQQNVRAGYDRFALFEMNKVHSRSYGLNDEGLPIENNSLSFVYAANPKIISPDEGAAYFHARTYLDYLASKLSLKLDYDPLDSAPSYEVTKPYDWQRSAMVKDRKTGTLIGIVGEITATTRRNFKLPSYVAAFELSLDALKDCVSEKGHYIPLARFPHVTQDITFKTAIGQTFVDVQEQLEHHLVLLAGPHGYKVTCEATDIYHKEHSKNKHITFRIDMYHPDRTLTTDETNAYVSTVAGVLKQTLDIDQV